MRFTLLSLSLATSWATAFTFQEGTTDGFYIAYYNEAGNEVHVKNAPTDPAWINALRLSNPFLVAKKNGAATSAAEYTWCGCGISMNTGNCDAAVADLKKQLSPSANVPGGLAYYSVRGSVVAFVCNRAPAGSPSFATGDRLVISLSEITDRCGRYVPGTKFNFERRGSELDYGYMNWRKGLDFCRDAESSGRHSC